MIRNLIAALGIVALLAGVALAQPGTFTSDELDRPLSTWNAGASESPNQQYDPTADPETQPKGGGPPFLGEPLAGNNFVFVLDRSGSMMSTMAGFSPVYNSQGQLVSNPSRWQVIQSETASAISQMTTDDTFELILYQSSYAYWKNSLVIADENNKSDGISYIYSQYAGGGTMYHGPLQHAFNHSGYEDADTIIFMTDGFPADAGMVQSSYPGWVGGKSEEFQVQGFQVGGATLMSIMQWLDGQDKTTVTLK